MFLIISTVRCSIHHPTRRYPIQPIPSTYSTSVLHPSLTCYYLETKGNFELPNCTWSRDSILASVAWAQERLLQNLKMLNGGWFGKVTFCLITSDVINVISGIRTTLDHLVTDSVWFRKTLPIMYEHQHLFKVRSDTECGIIIVIGWG